MAHEPKPHGAFQQGAPASEEDAGVAAHTLKRLQALKAAGGLQGYKLVRDLPDGGQVIALDQGGVVKTIIVKPGHSVAPEYKFDGLATLFVPMLYSGRVLTTRVPPGDPVTVLLTEQTRRRLIKYAKDKPLGPKMFNGMKFAIPYPSNLAELGDQNSVFLITQYEGASPDWWSGAMADVVQIVSGYGRMDNGLGKGEMSRLALPPEVAKEVSEELAVRPVLPGYSGIPPQDGALRYDYKFSHTNGVLFDEGGRPWLTRVTEDGVYVMPLPLVPASETKAFRLWVEQVGDDELMAALVKFGGLPSGESFPGDEQGFKAWERAGVIIKVCSTADFYAHSSYSMALGWAFSAQGTEGYNTCWTFGSDGVKLGYGYKLSIKAGSAEYGGKLSASFDTSDPLEQQVLNSYLSALYKELNAPTQRNLAIKYKLRSVGKDAVLARAAAGGADEVSYWENLVLPPIAQFSGNVTRTATGKLWAPGLRWDHPQIKFPDLDTKACISFDFSHAEGYPTPGQVKCDTVMFGYYVGNLLKVVKYFRDDTTLSSSVDSDYEQCMIVGSWQQEHKISQGGLQGAFYTSDFDGRRPVHPIVTTTRITGGDLGYDSKPFFRFDFLYSMTGTMWRNRYFQHTTSIEREEGKAFGSVACIPFRARNAVFYGEADMMTGGNKQESRSVMSMRDPNEYRFFTYHKVFAFISGDTHGNVDTADKAEPFPSEGNPVWVMGYSHKHSPCSDFADQGDWVGGRPADYAWLIHPDNHTWNMSGGGGPPTTKNYQKHTVLQPAVDREVHLSMMDPPELVSKTPSIGFYRPSPDEYGNTFYAEARGNAAGDSDYINCSEPDPEQPNVRKHWGYSALADHTKQPVFIGVIHE